ncbi:hypothetical protein PspS35_15945 [Pseudomonas sp. S35]|uniref:hypothetical protein n=1 Tax=Pseudomonas sp. S35 TaxID=1573719 RepID=UPI00132F4EE1|nr:hypothetical protein [Pseudomonas sp. S35]QHF45202.1 hypothetical protein PspS35_15945 [Pseudomonas sp. S35]
MTKNTNLIINERVVFADEGEKFGWTGGGSIIDDDVSGRRCWLVLKASKEYPQTLPPHSEVTVILFGRVRLSGSKLKCTHSGGTYTSPNDMLNSQMTSYWVRNAKADAQGKFWIHLETDNGQALRIHQMEVMAPVNLGDTPESLGMTLLSALEP